jgi:hypothetical protein
MTLEQVKQAGVDYMMADPNVLTVQASDGVEAHSLTWMVSGTRGKAVTSMSIFTGDPAGWEAAAQTRWDNLLTWMGQ